MGGRVATAVHGEGHPADSLSKSRRRAMAVQADLARPQDIHAVFSACDRSFGRLDVLVLNAAAIPHGLMTEISLDEFDNAFAVNTRAAFIALRLAAERMAADGRIVTISTGLTASPNAQTSAYAASKSALEVLTRVFALEMGPRGIRVNCLRPGVTDTEAVWMPQHVLDAIVAATPFSRLGQPGEVADAAAFLISPDARWVTGSTLAASGGL